MMLQNRDQPLGSDVSALSRGTVKLSIPELNVSLGFEMALLITRSWGRGTSAGFQQRLLTMFLMKASASSS
jgi:hypothetical protein